MDGQEARVHTRKHPVTAAASVAGAIVDDAAAGGLSTYDAVIASASAGFVACRCSQLLLHLLQHLILLRALLLSLLPVLHLCAAFFACLCY